MLQEHRLSDKAPVSDLIHEPAHEAVSVDAVEQDAGLVVRRAAVVRLQQHQVTARIPATHALTIMRGTHLRRGQQGGSLAHGVLSVQHEVVRTGAERYATVRVLSRSDGPQEKEEKEEVGGGGWKHFQVLSSECSTAKENNQNRLDFSYVVTKQRVRER